MSFWNKKSANYRDISNSLNVVSQRKMSGKLVNDIDETKVMKYAVYLILVTVFLVAAGLIMLYSASFGIAGLKYFQNQVVWAFIGTASGFAVYYIGYKKLAEFSPYMVLIVVILLIFAFFGPEINGAHRWIRIRLPGLTLSLQPSELTKIALAFFLADYCSKNYRTFPNLWDKYGMIVPGIVTCIVLGAILIGEDLGTTLLVAIMAAAIFFVAGVKLRYVFLPLIFLSVLSLYVYFFDATRLARVTSFLDTEKYQNTTGYQLWISKLALGSGSWQGQGFMCSRLKAKYLPEAHTDFILSIVGEELGYIGMIGILVFYALFCYFSFQISMNSKTKLGMFLGFGITCFIAFQTLINVLVIAGLAPTKGMPAPFISYGGSNLLSCLIAVGVLLSIAIDTVNEDYNYKFYQKLHAIKGLFVKKNG